jgi:hypothetical protein
LAFLLADSVAAGGSLEKTLARSAIGHACLHSHVVFEDFHIAFAVKTAAFAVVAETWAGLPQAHALRRQVAALRPTLAITWITLKIVRVVGKSDCTFLNTNTLVLL